MFAILTMTTYDNCERKEEEILEQRKWILISKIYVNFMFILPTLEDSEKSLMKY